MLRIISQAILSAAGVIAAFLLREIPQFCGLSDGDLIGSDRYCRGRGLVLAETLEQMMNPVSFFKQEPSMHDRS